MPSGSRRRDRTTGVLGGRRAATRGLGQAGVRRGDGSDEATERRERQGRRRSPVVAKREVEDAAEILGRRGRVVPVPVVIARSRTGVLGQNHRNQSSANAEENVDRD